MENENLGLLRQMLMRELAVELNTPNIVNRVDKIGRMLDWAEENYTDLFPQICIEVKNAVQNDAWMHWKLGGHWGAIIAATGVGKSKIAVTEACNIFDNHDTRYTLSICLIVPTEKLRDEGWAEEFKKWDGDVVYDFYVTKVCYASIAKIEGQEFDLVIGDEFQNFTEANSVFLKNNKIKKLMLLSATPPSDPVKISFLKAAGVKLDYIIPLDIAVKLKLTAQYKITILECRMEDIAKTIQGGTKAKPFMTTEKKQYDYLTTLVNKSFSLGPRVSKMRILNRVRYLKNLDSISQKVKFILQNFISSSERVLIFCGGIPQANEICENRFHSKTTDTAYQKFRRKEINVMSCVAALNEGENIDDISTIFITCPESGDLTVTQQIGRGVRFKPGYVCHVIIMCIIDTVAMKWLTTALAGFDQSKIRRIRYENIISGNTKL